MGVTRHPGDLTTGPLLRKSVAFGTPLAMALMGHGLFNLVDLLIIGRLPEEGPVAAVTIAGIVLTVAFLIFDGISNVTVALTAHAHGARQRRMLHDVAWESFWLTLALGLAAGFVFHVLSWPLMELFRFKDPKTTLDGVHYIQVMAWGMVTMFLIMMTTAVLRGVGNSAWPMIIMVGANALNIVLDIVLVFGYLGFPRLGTMGAALATVIARGLGGLLGLWLIWRGCGAICMRRFRFRRPVRFVRTLFVVGLPTSLQLAARVLVVFFLLKIAERAYRGPAEFIVAGVGICIRLEMVAVFLGLGWGAAATTLVGQNLGARRIRRASRGTWLMVLLGALSMSLVGAVIWVWQDPILHLIVPDLDPEALAAAKTYLAITIPFYPALALALVLSRALNGATSTRTPMVIDLITGFVITLPLAAWLSHLGFLGLFGSGATDPGGVWWAAVVAHVITGIIYVVVFYRGSWRRKRVMDRLPRSAMGAAMQADLWGEGPLEDSR